MTWNYNSKDGFDLTAETWVSDSSTLPIWSTEILQNTHTATVMKPVISQIQQVTGSDPDSYSSTNQFNSQTQQKTLLYFCFLLGK